MGEILNSETFRELVNDSQFSKFSNNTCKYCETTEDLSPCMYVGGLTNYGAY